MRAVLDYDEARVAAIARDVSEAVDRAAFDFGNWGDVPLVLGEAFPGSFASLWNFNLRKPDENFAAAHNMPLEFQRSYEEHFASINPWTSYWESIPHGTVAASEIVAPARAFNRTEFYNDWLLPQNNAEAAVGLKLAGGSGEILTFTMHYTVSKSERYETAAIEVLTRVRNSVDRSTTIARLLRKRSEMAVAGAALLERSQCAAFVTDTSRSVRDANAPAAQMFSRGGPVSATRGRAALSDNEADARFGQLLRSMARSMDTERSIIAFRDACGAWEVVLVPLQSGWETSSLLLVPPARLVLVLVTEIKHSPDEIPALSNLSTLFGLTKVEIAFCRKLLAGESVNEVSESSGLSKETARTRMKTILHKTNSPRQSHLMLLLSKLR